MRLQVKTETAHPPWDAKTISAKDDHFNVNVSAVSQTRQGSKVGKLSELEANSFMQSYFF